MTAAVGEGAAGGIDRLTLALPKGRLLEEVGDLLARSGLPAPGLADGLLVEDKPGGLRYILARPSDVVTYVKEGAADLGVTGKDILMENPSGYCELLDLRVGRCRLAVAGALPEGMDWPAFLRHKGNRLRVATKHPVATRAYFAAQGLTPAVITLGGALELAPRVGLADVIVDLVQTGRTLKVNGLRELAEIAPVTARLVANPVSLRFKAPRVEEVLQSLRAALCAGGGGDAGAAVHRG